MLAIIIMNELDRVLITNTEEFEQAKLQDILV